MPHLQCELCASDDTSRLVILECSRTATARQNMLRERAGGWMSERGPCHSLYLLEYKSTKNIDRCPFIKLAENKKNTKNSVYSLTFYFFFLKNRRKLVQEKETKPLFTAHSAKSQCDSKNLIILRTSGHFIVVGSFVSFVDILTNSQQSITDTVAKWRQQETKQAGDRRSNERSHAKTRAMPQASASNKKRK